MRRAAAALAVACLSVLAYAADFGSLEKSFGLGFSASPYTHTEEATRDADKSRSTLDANLFGVSAFFDLSYVQASLGFGWSSRSVALKVVDDLGLMGGGVDASYGDYYAETYIAFGLLAKYPFDLGGFYVFPAIGVEYDLNLSYTDAAGGDLKASMSGDQKSNLNMLWLKAGCGLDIPIAGKLYLRPEVLACYKLRSKLERDAIDAYEAGGAKDASVTTVKFDIGLMLGWSLN